MMRQKLILYSPKLTDCQHFSSILNTEYEITTSESEEEFFEVIQNSSMDAAIICFCSAFENDIKNLLRLDILTGPVPVLTCSKILNPEFIRKATQRGIERFLLCDMDTDKVRDIINDAIRDTGLKEYLNSHWQNNPESSPHANKLIDEIIYVFPHRIKIEELAGKVGIDRSWLHKLCKQTFNRSPTVLIRLVWVHQALRMMKHTNLNNIDIAMQLNYSEESSMAREFRKELGYSPNTARKKLITKSPEELLP